MGIINDDICQSGLVLGLGLTATANISSSPPPQRLGEPSLTLSLFGEAFDQKSDDLDYNKVCSEDINDVCGGGGQESGASYSSLSNVSVKRDREMGGEEVETDRVSSRVSDEDDDGPNGRKKLRLTKAQSALLEESFKHHSTLNPKQKQDLARDLKLRPRQVEVWFQNRRARTKLKQTEVDCEFLKKCCETLSDENRRLQKELQELKALKLSPPLYMQMPAATLTLCPSCERIGGGAAEKAARIPFARPRFYNPFPNPSAAC